MLNRHPCKLAILGFLALVLVYAKAKDPVYEFLQSHWYALAYRDQVQDRSLLNTRCVPYCFGMYKPELPWDYSGFFARAAELDQNPRIVSWYQAWGDRPESAFKKEAFEAARKGQLIPLVTWEPWISGFSRYRGEYRQGSLAHIIAGEFDSYIRSWARSAVRHGEPFFLRPLHEASNPWYEWSPVHGNTPELYVAAWRHIVDLFRKEGARNVAFVWTPYSPADTACWPGDDVVDWIGIDVFNYGTLLPGGQSNSFADLSAYHWQPLARMGKPLMIAETSTTSFGGDAHAWWRTLFSQLGTGALPPLRALVLFDNPAGMSPAGLPVDWRLPTL